MALLDQELCRHEPKTVRRSRDKYARHRRSSFGLSGVPRPHLFFAAPRNQPRAALVARINPQPVERDAEPVADADQEIDIRKAIMSSLAVLMAKAEASGPDLDAN